MLTLLWSKITPNGLTLDMYNRTGDGLTWRVNSQLWTKSSMPTFNPFGFFVMILVFGLHTDQ